ncbi:MAG TPA: sensor histidine kinase, partial [Burkholderiaceae bacterium]
MPNRSARIIFSVWILFWVLMATVQLQEYIKSGRTRYWEPVFWEASSAVVITALLLAQRRLM